MTQSIQELILKERQGDWDAFKALVKMVENRHEEAISWAKNLTPDKNSVFSLICYDGYVGNIKSTFVIAETGNIYAWNSVVDDWYYDQWEPNMNKPKVDMFKLSYRLGNNKNMKARNFFMSYAQIGRIGAWITLAEECEKGNKTAIHDAEVMLRGEEKLAFCGACYVLKSNYTVLRRLIIKCADGDKQKFDLLTDLAEYPGYLVHRYSNILFYDEELQKALWHGKFYYARAMLVDLLLLGNKWAIEWFYDNMGYKERVNEEVIDIVFDHIKLGNHHALDYACMLLKRDNFYVKNKVLRLSRKNLALREAITDYYRYIFRDDYYCFQDFKEDVL